MTQHALTIANQNGASFRSDLVNAIQALGSNNAGPSAPSPTYPNMWWPDTTAMILKRRNNANSAWLNIMDLATGLIVGADIQAYDVNTVKKNVANVFTATQTPDNGTAAVSTTSTVTFDGGDQVREYTFTNGITVTFGAPTGIVEHAMYKFKLKAGDTAARAFAWNAAYKFSGGVPPLTAGTQVSDGYDTITWIGGAGNTLIYDGHIADAR